MFRTALAAFALIVASLLLITAAAAQVDDPSAPVGDDVLDQIATGPALVIVALDTPPVDPASGGGVAEIASAQERILDAVPDDSRGSVVQFENVPAMAMVVRDSAAIEALASSPDVARVDLDVGGTGSLTQTVILTDTDQRHSLGNDGDGVVVAVLDSGIDSDHPDLIDDAIITDQACFGYNASAAGVGFCPNGSDMQTGSGSAEDDAGHGTHVSGIVSSNGSVSAPGFAPGAEILALKTTDDCSFSGCFYSFTLNVVAALDYIIANPGLGVDVINMSLGTNATFAGDCDASTSWTIAGAAAIDTLRASGVIAFASAGNNASSTNMSAPACLSNVIAVGASDDLDVAAPFTNVSTTTDLFAPGVNVQSAAIGGGVTPASGTSMASPSAAGCAALLIESGEATTPLAIETRLETSATTVLAANGLAYPRLDCGADLCNGLAVTVDIGAGETPTSGADVILGTTGVDAISSLGGADTICALDGADTINGGMGVDTIFAGKGDDTIGGQGGVDTIYGEGGNDMVFGGMGNDQIWGGTGDDDLRGQGGNDVLHGEDGVDQFFGGPGDDEIHTGPGGNVGTTQVVRGQGNNDTIFGGPDDDELDGGPGLDEIHAGPGSDVLHGGNSFDMLWGDDGPDTLFGADGRDILHGGSSDDQLSGGLGDDDLYGEAGDDDLDGQGGADLCDGGTDDEVAGDSASATCETVVAVP